MSTRSFHDELPLLQQSKKILKANESNAISAAIKLLEAAKEDIKKKKKEIQQERKLEKKAGFEEGQENARKEAILHHWKTVINTVTYLESMQEEMAKAISHAVRKLIQTAPPAEQAIQLATAAVERLRQQAWVVLCLHPEDVDAVNRLLENWKTHLPQNMRVETRASKEIHRGDCVLESPIGRVDASLETQLSIIQEQMQKML
jgi:type III secretion protein L